MFLDIIYPKAITLNSAYCNNNPLLKWQWWPEEVTLKIFGIFGCCDGFWSTVGRRRCSRCCCCWPIRCRSDLEVRFVEEEEEFRTSGNSGRVRCRCRSAIAGGSGDAEPDPMSCGDWWNANACRNLRNVIARRGGLKFRSCCEESDLSTTRRECCTCRKYLQQEVDL